MFIFNWTSSPKKVLRSKSGNINYFINYFLIFRDNMSLDDMKLDFFFGGSPCFLIMEMVGRWVGCQPVTNNNNSNNNNNKYKNRIKTRIEEELSISFQKRFLAKIIEIHRYYFLFPVGEPLPLPLPASRTGLACPAVDSASALFFCFSLLLSFWLSFDRSSLPRFLGLVVLLIRS